MEILTAFVDESGRGVDHVLSRKLLLGYAPDPLPAEMYNFVSLVGQIISLLEISIQGQAALATAFRGHQVSVGDILATLGKSIEVTA
jgi:hypothetical protein